jgi:formylglycine-generating enzyme required for sulfatase activity/lipopolysaccharide biosynthesis regulator YciM
VTGLGFFEGRILVMLTEGGFNRVGLIATAACVALIVIDAGSELLQVNSLSVVLAQEAGGREMSAGERPANPKVVHHKATASARGRRAFLAEQAVERGNSARDTRDYSRAETEYRKALELNPKEERAYLGLGNVYFDQHQYPEAVDAYQNAIGLKQNYAEGHSNLSYAYMRQGRLDDAEKAANRALDLNPSLATAMARLGHVYQRRYKYPEAIAQYQRAINADPTYAEPHNSLGNVYLSLKRYSEAIDQYHRAIALSSEWSYPHYNLGRLFRDLKRYREAIAEYQRALTLDGKWSYPHNGLGVVYRDLKRYGEAIAEYQRAIDIDLENDPLPHNNLGDVYFWDHQGSSAAAIKEYKEAIRLDPKWAEPYFSLGSVYRQDGRQDEAKPQFQMYIELVPKRRNQAGIDMIWIPPGRFMMGLTDAEAQSAYEDAKRYNSNAKLQWFIDAKQKHQVTIREGFYMGRYEVTQAQWQKIMGTSVRQQRDKTNTSYSMRGEGDNYPIYYVSWNEAQEFIQKLNQMNDGYIYSLPTEAEWEYTARAGTTTPFFWGQDANRACQYANVADQTAKENPGWTIVDCRDGYAETSPVGSFQSNPLGLYDIIGNVWEWCEDVYHDSYNGAPTDGSGWLSGGEQKLRMLRGGSWSNWAFNLRSAGRLGYESGTRQHDIGFRVVAVTRTQ